MSKVTKTYEEFLTFLNYASANAGDQSTKAQKKLAKISEKFKKDAEAYNEAIQDLRLDAASVDDKNNLVTDAEGGYKFTKEAAKELNKKTKELLQKEVQFEVVNVVNPAGLEGFHFLEGWVEGVVFNEKDPEEEL